MIPDYFRSHILSFELGAMKPDPPIYQAAVEAAGIPAGEVFFTDDRPENVAGAKQVGIDAVLFTSPQQLIADLTHRGVRFNL